MKSSATGCLVALLLSAGISWADDSAPTVAATPSAPANTTGTGAGAPTSDLTQATNEAREQLIEAQKMADAAQQAAATRSDEGSTSSGNTTSSVQSDSNVQSSSSTHHAMGELLDIHLRPDYSDSHHHSMGALAP